MRKGLLYDLFPETALTRKSVHPDVSPHSHLPRVKPVSSCLSLEDMGHFLQGFHIRSSETGINASPLLTCLLAGHLWFHKVGLVPAQARRHILTLAIQGSEASGELCKGYTSCCTDRETESQSQKRGFPHQALGLLMFTAILSLVCPGV